MNEVILIGVIKGKILYEVNRMTFMIETFLNNEEYTFPKYIHPTISSKDMDLIMYCKNINLKEGDVIYIKGYLNSDVNNKCFRCETCTNKGYIKWEYSFIEANYIHILMLDKKNKRKNKNSSNIIENFDDETYKKIRSYRKISNEINIKGNKLSTHLIEVEGKTYYVEDIDNTNDIINGHIGIIIKDKIIKCPHCNKEISIKGPQIKIINNKK